MQASTSVIASDVKISADPSGQVRDCGTFGLTQGSVSWAGFDLSISISITGLHELSLLEGKVQNGVPPSPVMHDVQAKLLSRSACHRQYVMNFGNERNLVVCAVNK